MFSLYGNKDDYNSKKKFNINQRVMVDGYKGRVFSVEKYYSKDTYTGGKRAFEVVYTVKDISTGELMTAYPEDMHLYTSEYEKQDKIDKHKKNIDDALDSYNNRMLMYKEFGDIEYKEKADEILELLKEYIDESKEEFDSE